MYKTRCSPTTLSVITIIVVRFNAFYQSFSYCFRSHHVHCSSLQKASGNIVAETSRSQLIAKKVTDGQCLWWSHESMILAVPTTASLSYQTIISKFSFQFTHPIFSIFLQVVHRRTNNMAGNPRQLHLISEYNWDCLLGLPFCSNMIRTRNRGHAYISYKRGPFSIS